MYVKSFKQLIVWQKSVKLSVEIYKITEGMPKFEIYGLTSQMRRSAVAVPSNIAEGKKRKTKNDFLHFLRIANGSAAELETQIIIAKKIYKDISYKKAEGLLEEIQKMLTTIIIKLENKKAKS